MQRGYPVYELPHCGNIDIARSVLASRALAAGSKELFWIDGDVIFDPQDVEKLRSHDLPFACGIYVKRGMAQLACCCLDETTKITLGARGGLQEIRFSGFGFVSTKAEVYEKVQKKFLMPACRPYLEQAVTPYFMPAVIHERGEPWYLPEDYSFCWRVSACGVKIMADTTIKLGHVSRKILTWDDLAQPTVYETLEVVVR